MFLQESGHYVVPNSTGGLNIASSNASCRLPAEQLPQVESEGGVSNASFCHVSQQSELTCPRSAQTTMRESQSVQDFSKGQRDVDSCQRRESLFSLADPASAKSIRMSLFNLVAPKLTGNTGPSPQEEDARQCSPSNIALLDKVVPDSSILKVASLPLGSLPRAVPPAEVAPDGSGQQMVGWKLDTTSWSRVMVSPEGGSKRLDRGGEQPAVSAPTGSPPTPMDGEVIKRAREGNALDDGRAKRAKIEFEMAPRLHFPFSSADDGRVGPSEMMGPEQREALREREAMRRPKLPRESAAKMVVSSSSGSAMSVAESMIMETDCDEESTDRIQEQFVKQTGVLASAIEEMIGSVGETTEMMSQLALELLTANNEVLLMNASLLRDEKMKVLEECTRRLLEE